MRGVNLISWCDSKKFIATGGYDMKCLAWDPHVS